MRDIVALDALTEGVAFRAGYRAWVENPEDLRDAKERGLYLNNQDLRIAWGCGWDAAWFEGGLLGINIAWWVEHGVDDGVPVGKVHQAVQDLRAAAAGAVDVAALRALLNALLLSVHSEEAVAGVRRALALLDQAHTPPAPARAWSPDSAEWTRVHSVLERLATLLGYKTTSRLRVGNGAVLTWGEFVERLRNRDPALSSFVDDVIGAGVKMVLGHMQP